MAAERLPADVTGLLHRLSEGDQEAMAELYPLIYRQLRTLARRYLASERAGHTLEPTALVHEAYLKLAGYDRDHWNDREHFLAVAARAMRQVLTDHARRHLAAKRGDAKVTIDTGVAEIAAADSGEVDCIALDDLLQRLEKLNARHARLVELRVFAGMSLEEVARVLGVSLRTLNNDWRFAKAWLRREMGA